MLRLPGDVSQLLSSRTAQRIARVVALDRANDLALLQADLPKLTSFPPLRSNVPPGEDVAVFGFPFSGSLSATGNVTFGNVTAQAGLRDDRSRLQVSAPVQPGNSGGPVLDNRGNVVGVVVSKLNAVAVASATGDVPQNVNFAIKGSVATSFLEANGVATFDASAVEMSKPDLAERAEAFTVLVACQR